MAVNRRLVGSLGQPKGELLDVGAGKGHFMAAARELGWHVDGIEFSAASAATAAELYGVEVRVADFMSMPDDGRLYDAVVMIHVLEHLPDPRFAIARARSLLAPGGRLLISVPNAASLQARLFGSRWLHLDLPRHLYHFTPDALSVLLEGSGFEVTHRDTFSPDIEITGFVQSVLNRVGLGSNVAVRFIKRDATVGGIGATLGPLVVATVTVPGAIAWAIAAPMLGGGASLQMVGRASA
jgi:SAM-dependent methyltransferase